MNSQQIQSYINNEAIYIKKQSSPINIITTTPEYKLKSNNFNPIKNSPNFFLLKLQNRLRGYHLEEDIGRESRT